LTTDKTKVLKVVIEELMEDWKSLWELHWAVREELGAEAKDSDIRPVLLEVLKVLLNQNAIIMRTGKWARNDYSMMPSVEFNSALEKDENWALPATNDSCYVSIALVRSAKGPATSMNVSDHR
jgi:hypothetical protein